MHERVCVEAWLSEQLSGFVHRAMVCPQALHEPVTVVTVVWGDDSFLNRAGPDKKLSLLTFIVISAHFPAPVLSSIEAQSTKTWTFGLWIASRIIELCGLEKTFEIIKSNHFHVTTRPCPSAMLRPSWFLCTLIKANWEHPSKFQAFVVALGYHLQMWGFFLVCLFATKLILPVSLLLTRPPPYCQESPSGFSSAQSSLIFLRGLVVLLWNDALTNKHET